MNVLNPTPNSSLGNEDNPSAHYRKRDGGDRYPDPGVFPESYLDAASLGLLKGDEVGDAADGNEVPREGT